MRIWTEEGLVPVMDVLEYLLDACQEYDGTNGEAVTRLKHWIQSGAPELEDQTIYGFRIRDLVPLASILRAKGVSPKEIEDWRKDLQGLLDFVAEQEMEAHQKAVADVLKGFKGPDKETRERFAATAGWVLAPPDEELGPNELSWRNIYNPKREKNEENEE